MHVVHTEKSVRDVLRSKMPNIKLLEIQGSFCRLLCTKHQTILTPTTQYVMGGRHGCKECWIDKNRLKFEAGLAKTHPTYKCTAYRDAWTFTLRCKIHGTSWDSSHYKIRQCPDCKETEKNERKHRKEETRREIVERRKQEQFRLSKQHILSRLKESKHIEPAGSPYKKGRCWRIKARCVYCSHEWYARVENIYAGTRCKKCSMRWAKNKSFQLGDRNVMVQGSEPVVLNHLIYELKVNPKYIEVDKVPVIPYLFKNRRHRYYPDFFIEKKNMLIEVKSVHTLGLGSRWYGRKKPPYEQNIAKQNACLSAGYSYKLFVVQKNVAVLLPSDWTDKPKELVRRYIDKHSKL